MRHRFCFVALLLSLAGFGQARAAVSVTTLCCDGLANPQGIDNTTPLVSWQMASDQPTARGLRQTAYQILVASSPENLAQDKGDLWDSGRVASDQCVDVTYAGSALATRAAAYWKVRVWDQTQQPSDWSAPAQWSMGLLAPSDWQAQWIGRDGPPNPTTDVPVPARWLRKEFTADKPVRRATVSFSGLGESELYLNGAKVGDAVLSPALSDYDKRVYYVTYDVTSAIKQGANALGVVLGNGRFYSVRLEVSSISRTFGYPKLLLQLHLDYADGTSADVVSDGSWKLTTGGPIRANNDYNGEDYDARLEMPGWAAPGFDDSSWPAAQVVAAPAGALCAQRSEPIRVTGTLKPISVKEISPGVFIYDMGQNMVGWCRLTVNGPAGAHVTLRFAERLHDDGTLSTENLRSAQATDHYTLKGDGPESWEPRFTYHGFRYVEVTGFPGRPPLDALEGHVVNDDLAPAGDFACSDPTINQIYHNILWGVRSNYRSIATDCPQRDERQGWLGDRASTCRSESFLWLNGDFYAKWLQDIMDDERDDGAIPDVAPTYWSRYNDDVTWATTLITIPENLLDQFGDTATLAHAYPAMVKFIDHMETLVTPDGLLPIDKYGDWCMPPTDPKIIHDRSPALNTDGRISSTTYLYHCLQLMSRYAKLLNKPDDGARFDALAAKLKDGLNNQLYNRDLGQYDNGAQTATILPLAFGMVPDDQRQRVVDHLVQKITVEAHGHIGTGVLGSGWINEVLNDNGHGDIAYAMATTHTYPSFGYEIDHGATTVWELWNGDTADPSMNSGNHVMLIGDTGVWMFEDLAGIKSDPDQPGYKNILMRPTPVGNLTFVKASHQSPYGLIESEWHLDGGNFRWHITVPPNSTATVFVPTNAPDSVQENGQNAAASPGVTFLRAEPGHAVYQVQSGQYDFTAKNG